MVDSVPPNTPRCSATNKGTMRSAQAFLAYHPRLNFQAPLLSFLLLTSHLSLPLANCIPQNITCDDQNPCQLPAGSSPIVGAIATINFLPNDGWTQGSTCTGCAVHADPSQTFDGTWHDTTLDQDKVSQERSFNITFLGTSPSPRLQIAPSKFRYSLSLLSLHYMLC